MPAIPIIHLDLPHRSFQPACAITNDVINFGWEYVVHCHILGYDENNMMRAQMLATHPILSPMYLPSDKAPETVKLCSSRGQKVHSMRPASPFPSFWQLTERLPGSQLPLD
jgi:hypothetical protein